MKRKADEVEEGDEEQDELEDKVDLKRVRIEGQGLTNFKGSVSYPFLSDVYSLIS